jgi:hypothetical protein
MSTYDSYNDDKMEKFNSRTDALQYKKYRAVIAARKLLLQITGLFVIVFVITLWHFRSDETAYSYSESIEDDGSNHVVVDNVKEASKNANGGFFRKINKNLIYGGRGKDSLNLANNEASLNVQTFAVLIMTTGDEISEKFDTILKLGLNEFKSTMLISGDADGSFEGIPIINTIALNPSPKKGVQRRFMNDNRHDKISEGILHSIIV